LPPEVAISPLRFALPLSSTLRRPEEVRNGSRGKSPSNPATFSTKGGSADSEMVRHIRVELLGTIK
jgi:hypothetical protein